MWIKTEILNSHHTVDTMRDKGLGPDHEGARARRWNLEFGTFVVH